MLSNNRFHCRGKRGLLAGALLSCILLFSPSVKPTLAQTATQASVQAQVLKNISILKTSKDYSDLLMACAALGRIGTPAAPAVPALTEFLTPGHDNDVQAVASNALGQIGKPAVPALTELLTPGHNKTVLANASDALGEIGAPASSAVFALTKLLTPGQDKEVLRSASDALGKIGAPASSAVFALTKLLTPSQDFEVLRSAFNALGRIGAPASSAVPALTKLLTPSQNTTSSYKYVPIYASEVLAEIAAKVAVATNKDQNKKDQLPLNDVKKIVSDLEMASKKLSEMVKQDPEHKDDSLWLDALRLSDALAHIKQEVAEREPKPWSDQPWFHSVVAFAVICLLAVLGKALRGNIERWVPIGVYLLGGGATLLGEHKDLLDRGLLAGLLAGAVAVALAAGALSPSVFRELERSEPFRWLAPFALSIPLMRRRLYAAYVRRVSRDIKQASEKAQNEVYAPIPVRVREERTGTEAGARAEQGTRTGRSEKPPRQRPSGHAWRHARRTSAPMC